MVKLLNYRATIILGTKGAGRADVPRSEKSFRDDPGRQTRAWLCTRWGVQGLWGDAILVY